jgi:cell division protein FtsI/penicillin-binding protein 2
MMDYRIPRRRILSLFVGFIMFCLAIGYRVFSFQVVKSEALSEEAVATRFQESAVPAQRGNIYDARRFELATNVPADQVSVIVNKLVDANGTSTARVTAQKLAPLIGRTADDIFAAITQPGKEWVVLKRRLPDDASQQIKNLNLPSIVLESEPRRIYPMGDFASQVLGFVNYDYVGSYGVEGAYDKIVGGTPGKLIGQRDNQGNVIALAKSAWDPPIDGANLTLTIDNSVQWIIEKALDEAIAAQQAAGGTIIVEDPKTGAILGMASRPSFNPNDFDTVTDAKLFENPAISDAYEPGSTFKTLTMSLGLEAGVVTPNTTHNGGPYTIIPGGEKVYNALDVDFGLETMTEVLEHSSNLGAMWVGQLTGEDRYYRGLVAFGLGKPTGIDLEGESAGILPLPGDSNWTSANFYTNAFGQGLAVTPLQMVNAVSVLANGGLLMKPYVVSGYSDKSGTKTVEPTVVHRVISETTSHTITEMLTTVMNVTYVKYTVPGYDIATKSGTAQVPSPNGGYYEDKTIGSLLGYGPSDDPQFAIIVKIDEPKLSPWGETAAGPAYQKVFQQLFMLYGIPPTKPVVAIPTTAP